MKKIPVIDVGRCTKCEGCMAVAPNIFRFNTPMGFVEVIDLLVYPEDLVDEAIAICPADCIFWDEE